jgi:hypothetical protein
MTPPEASVTVPVNAPVAAVCASRFAVNGIRQRNNTAKKANLALEPIFFVALLIDFYSD